MIYKQKIHTDLQINTLEDLAKLKLFLEDGKNQPPGTKDLLLMIITTSSGNSCQMKTSRFSITNVFYGSF